MLDFKGGVARVLKAAEAGRYNAFAVTRMDTKKFEYYIEFVNENGDSEECETVAETDEEAFSNFESDTGYDESDVLVCKRSAL